MTRRWRGPLAALLLAAPLAAAPGARAQLPHLDPLPHFVRADSTSRLAGVFELERREDPRTDWVVNRVLATAILPAGGRAAWFLRVPVVSFRTGGLSAGARWPQIVGDELPGGWPDERTVAGIGQVEGGVTGPLGFWFFEHWRYGVALGLPTAGERLYPWASGGLPLRLELRPGVPLGGGRYLWVRGALVSHVDASGNELTPEAFPDGVQAGAEFAWYAGRGRRWLLTWDYDDREGRVGQRLGATAWLPWTRDASVGLHVARELGDEHQRNSLWTFSLSFRFDGAAATDDGTAPLLPPAE